MRKFFCPLCGGPATSVESHEAHYFTRPAKYGTPGPFGPCDPADKRQIDAIVKDGGVLESINDVHTLECPTCPDHITSQVEVGRSEHAVKSNWPVPALIQIATHTDTPPHIKTALEDIINQL